MKDFLFGNFNLSLVKKSKNLFDFSFSAEDVIKEVHPETGSLISLIYNDSILLKNHIIKISKNNYLYFISQIRDEGNPIFISIKKKQFESNLITKLLKRQKRLLRSYASLIEVENELYSEVGSDISILNIPEQEYDRADSPVGVRGIERLGAYRTFSIPIEPVPSPILEEEDARPRTRRRATIATSPEIDFITESLRRSSERVEEARIAQESLLQAERTLQGQAEVWNIAPRRGNTRNQNIYNYENVIGPNFPTSFWSGQSIPIISQGVTGMMPSPTLAEAPTVPCLAETPVPSPF